MVLGAAESTLPVLLLILFLGLLLPDITRKLKLPFISILILLGALAGPKGAGYVQPNEAIELFGFLGSAFLMLLAGLEVKPEHYRQLQAKSLKVAAFNAIIPFIVGVAIVRYFGYAWLPALMIGTVFASSSVMLVTTALRNAGLTRSKAGELMISTVVLEDGVSLLLLSLVLQAVSPITPFPMVIYVGILISSIVILQMFIPEFAKYYFRRLPKRDQYEGRLRFVLVVLIAVMLYFAGLGVHPILASFIVGVLLADTVGSQGLYNKLHTLGYGLFVPVFFFIVGMEMDLSLLAAFDYRNVLILSIIVGSITAKSISGYVSMREVGAKKRFAYLFGAASTAQLTTTLAATYAAASLQILDATLVTAILLLSMVTTLCMPVLFNRLAEGVND